MLVLKRGAVQNKMASGITCSLGVLASASEHLYYKCFMTICSVLGIGWYMEHRTNQTALFSWTFFFNTLDFTQKNRRKSSSTYVQRMDWSSRSENKKKKKSHKLESALS